MEDRETKTVTMKGVFIMHRKKLTAEQKIQMVKEYYEGKESKAQIAERYGVDHALVRDCIIKYEAQGIEGFLDQERNKTYSEQLRLQAIGAYKNGEGTLREIAAKYGLRSESQLRKWIKVYNSGRGFRQKMSGGSHMKEARPTTVEERIQIAKDCIANGGNYGETALKFNVSYQQVYQWVKKFKEKGNAGLEDRRGKRLKDQTPRTREEELEIEIAKLKHELYMTQMERDLLKKVDEIERREAYRK